MPEAHRGLKVVDGFWLPVWFGRSVCLMGFVPPAKSLRSADAEIWTGNHDPRWLGVEQWKQQIAAFEAEHGSTRKEERYVGTKTAGDGLQFGVGCFETPKGAQPEQRCCGVAASAAETGFHGNAFAEVNPNVRQRCAAPR